MTNKSHFARAKKADVWKDFGQIEPIEFEALVLSVNVYKLFKTDETMGYNSQKIKCECSNY